MIRPPKIITEKTGMEHWGQEIGDDPDAHTYRMVQHNIVDGVALWCSCGWGAMTSFEQYWLDGKKPQAAFDALHAAHEQHISSART